MSSPSKLISQHLLQSQIRHRSRFSENTSDFYQLKLHRLEQDFSLLQQQLNLARIRLRTAEDFQIKYQLLTKQNSSLLQQNSKLSKELGIRKIQNDKLITEISLINVSLEEMNRVILTKDSEILLLLDQIKQFQIQSQALAIRASRMHDGEVTTLKKANQDLENVMDEYQNSSNIKVEQLMGEIEKLNGLNGNLQDEVNRQSARHAEELNRVRGEFEAKEQENLGRLAREKERFEEFERESRLERERERREREQGGSQEEIGFMTKQINNLTFLLKDKEQQLQSVFQQKDANVEEWNSEREEFRNHIRLLQQKIYELQRQNQLQIINLKERLSKLHAEEINQLKKNEQDLIQAMKDIKPEQILKDKDQEIVQLNEKIYSDKNLHERDRDEIIKGIETLKDRIRQHNESADNQHKILTSLNLNIEQERTSKQTDYQNNLTFLDQQLKRANLTIQQKNLEIKKLLNELNDLKTDTEKDRKEMIQRAEGERKQLNQEIDQLIEQKQAMEEQLKGREKQLKVKDRELEEQAAKSASERKAYERLQQQLHNDCKRMAEELKLVERAARDERQKNIASVTELNNIRREKVGDLDRQKQEFQLLYRGRMDQLKDSLNLQIDKLRVERDRLQAELLQCRIELTDSQEDFKKVSSLVAQESKVNKQKLVEYQKKMATLNQEINLTQNLYNSFIDAKSRLKQSRSQKEN